MEQTEHLPSPLRRWLITITVMAATFMQVLDMTIANVALPHMQAALGANPETVNWVLTSYIVMAAIATPATGWLESHVGRRNLLFIAIVGFTASSAACGLAASLPMMVAARATQGLFGAFLGPLAQATMLDGAPPAKRAQAMLIFTMGITIGPIIGPVLGGWLTENYDWRWVFFINIPFGIAAAVGTILLLEKIDIAPRRLDMFGFSLLAVGLASTQLLFDRGTQQDWFESTEIVIEAGLAMAALWMFMIHIAKSKQSILPVGLLKNGTYLIGLLYAMLLTGTMIAGSALLAPMLQVLLGYDTLQAGMVMMPRGVGALIAMPAATFLIKRVDPRLLIGTGLSLLCLSFWMMSTFTMQMGGDLIILSAFIQGLGTGFTFMPVSIMAFANISPQLSTEAAVFFNLARNIGSSITVSVMGALFARNLQINHAELGERITSLPALQNNNIAHLNIIGNVTRMIDAEVNRQAMMIAYINDYWLMMWAATLAIPLILFMRKPKTIRANDTVIME